jgi:hypothetical protein
MDNAAPGPASLAAVRDAVRNGREPPPARTVARLVVGTGCVGAFMGQVDSSIAQMLLPRLEVEFGARLSTVSWVEVKVSPNCQPNCQGGGRGDGRSKPTEPVGASVAVAGRPRREFRFSVHTTGCGHR